MTLKIYDRNLEKIKYVPFTPFSWHLFDRKEKYV